MVRFLHTADWQIGMRAARLGPIASRVRQERLSAAERVVRLAEENVVDFVIVAGDTFEHNAVERSLVQRVADILGRCPRPVFLIPGNHDPAEPGCVWHHPAWRTYDNLCVFTDPVPKEVNDCVLYPCPVTDKFSRRDPTLWIEHRSGQKIGIGIAHGSIQGLADDPTLPLAPDAAVRSGLDYLALGHWHSVLTFPEPDGAIRMAYCGTHEPTAFGERQSGNVLLVAITDPGAVPEVEIIATGGLRWCQEERTIRDEQDLERLLADVDRWPEPQNTLLSLRVAGLLVPAASALLDRLRELLEARFLWSELDTSALRPAPEDHRWIEQLPPGMIREVAAQLLRYADPSAVERPEGVTAEVAALALSELYRFIGEAPR